MFKLRFLCYDLIFLGNFMNKPDRIVVVEQRVDDVAVLWVSATDSSCYS